MKKDDRLSRRDFMKISSGLFLSSTGFLSLLSPEKKLWAAPKDVGGHIFEGDAPDKLWKWSIEARYYHKLENNQVLCTLCPNSCLLSPGDRSVCRSRANFQGKLYSLGYGNPCAIHLDPVEKKPLFHFLPKSKAFSLAIAGCNLRCLNCQNWQISQAKPSELRHHELFPEKAVQKALDYQARSIAYTYSEPITFFEYMFKTGTLAKEKGLSNLLISNGYINKKPLLDLCKIIDAANINLKAFDNNIYKKLNGGTLKPVLNTFKTLAQQGVHFEMTNLVVPGYTDDPEMVKKMVDWILENLGPDYPLHFLRFFPSYKLNRLSPTPVSLLEDFRALALNKGIHYVYIGNAPVKEAQNTYCHKCGKLVVERRGYLIDNFNIEKGRCAFCQTQIPGIWEAIQL